MFSFTIRCPYCREKIRKDAVRCRHCHSSIGANGKASSQDDEGIRYLQIGFGKINTECDAIEEKMRIRTGIIFVRHQYSSDDLIEATGKIESFVEKMRADLEDWQAVNKLTDQVKDLFNRKAGHVYQRLESIQLEIKQREPTWWEKVCNAFKRIFEKLFSFFSFKMIAGRKPQKAIAA